jgi:TolA-binding protein
MLRKTPFIIWMIFLSSISGFPQTGNSVSNGNQIDSDLKFGLELFKNKMYELAEEQFTKFLQEYPSSVSAAQARYYLAMAQFEQGKFASASTNFQTFAIQYPNDPLAPTAWMNAGDAYANTKDYANAGLAYQRLQVFYPKDARAPFALAKAAKYFILAGDTSRAENSLLSVVQDYSTSPNYFDATLQLGNLYLGSGELLKAENQYKALLSSDDDSVRVMGLLALGKLNEMRGNYAMADKYFQDASQLHITPWSTDARLESIELNIEAGNYSTALEQADRVDNTKLTTDQAKKLEFEKVYASIAESPNDEVVANDTVVSTLSQRLKSMPTEYKLKLVSLLKLKGKYSLGIALLRELPGKDFNEQTADLYAELAFKTGKIKLADSLLLWCVTRLQNPLPKMIVKLLDLERIYLVQREHGSTRSTEEEEARQIFHTYQNTLKKDIPDAYLYYKAFFEDMEGDYEQALLDYRSLLDSYPESDYAKSADSSLNYISNFKVIDYRSAVSRLADIVSEQAIASSNSAQALLQLGQLYEEDLKNYKRAAEIYRQLASVTNGDTARLAEYRLARVLEKSSHYKVDEGSEAYSLYRKLAQQGGNSDLNFSGDSIAENSLFRMIEIECNSGDSLKAEDSALNFLKRFSGSRKAANVYWILSEILYTTGAYHEAIVQARLAGKSPEAQLVLARSEIAIDSLESAKLDLENLFNSGVPKKYLLEGKLIYINLLRKMNLDVDQAYLNFLGSLVPSDYKAKVAEQYADYLYSTARYDTAYSVYASLGEGQLWYTTPASVIYKMAYCKLKSGDRDDAKELFQQVATTSKDEGLISDSYNQLGKIYDSIGDKKMSAAFFARAGAGDILSLVAAADMYFKMGDYGDAAQIYKKILAEASADTLKAFSAARLIEIDYKTEKAEAADAAAATFKRNYSGENEYLAQFLLDKAEYLIKVKKYDEARKVLDQVRNDYRNSKVYPASILDQARILVETGQLDKAQEKLTDLIRSFPSSQAAVPAHLELGNIYFAKERFQDAIDNFRAVYADSSSAPDLMHDAMKNLISAYESAGQYDGALEVARKFIEKYPDDPSIMDMKIKVGILYEELRYFDQALITFQNLAKEASRSYQAELHYYIGAIYDDKGDYPNAILEFLKVPYLVSPAAVIDWAAQAYYMAGKCYEKLNKPNEAIAMYQKIVNKPHTDPTFVAGAEREINRVKALLK